MKDLLNYLNEKRLEAHNRQSHVETQLSNKKSVKIQKNKIILDSLLKIQRENLIIKKYLDNEINILADSGKSYYLKSDWIEYFNNKCLELEINQKRLLDEVDCYLEQKSHNKVIAAELIVKQRDNLSLIDFVIECKRDIYTEFLVETALASKVFI